MEIKTIDVGVQGLVGRKVTGFASIYGNVDSVGDITHFGAFRKTIMERSSRVRHLWQHDMSQPPVAVIRSMREVKADELPDSVRQRYPEATGGLEVVREYLDTPRGNEILEGLKAGAITEMSFGFDVVKADLTPHPEAEMKTQVRNLRELRLWDTSDVNWGANEATTAVKAAPWLDNYRGALPAEQFELVRRLVDVTDAVVLPEALKAGRVLSAANLTRLKEALTVLENILTAAEPPADEEDAKALTEQVLAKIRLFEHEVYFFGG